MPRHYLMCPPIHYTVSYEINPWMNVRVATDAQLAMTQWERLRQVYQELGHTVDVLDPLPQYPDMVYAANGATAIDGIACRAICPSPTTSSRPVRAFAPPPKPTMRPRKRSAGRWYPCNWSTPASTTWTPHWWCCAMIWSPTTRRPSPPAVRR